MSRGDGSKLPATERAGKYSLDVECGHRSSKSWEGGLKHHTCQGCFCHSRCPPDCGKGMFLPILCDNELLVHSKPGIDQ